MPTRIAAYLQITEQNGFSVMHITNKRCNNL